MSTGLTDLEKREYLCKEVCCATITSQTIPFSSSLFRLHSGGKFLAPAEYASNLAQYLDYAQSINTANLSELHDVNVQVRERETERQRE